MNLKIHSGSNRLRLNSSESIMGNKTNISHSHNKTLIVLFLVSTHIYLGRVLTLTLLSMSYEEAHKFVLIQFHPCRSVIIKIGEKFIRLHFGATLRYFALFSELI